MKFIYKLIISFFMLLIFLGVGYINLGNFLDITDKPNNTELLVCLGGGNHKKRVDKTYEIYKNGFLKGSTIIFTGVKKIDKKFDKVNIVINNEVTNTMEEVLFVKNYIKKHSINSVTFITEAPHSKRVKIFWENFGIDRSNTNFSVVASELKSWDSNTYYKNKFAKHYAFLEIKKLLYNFFVYGVLEKLGLKESFINKYQDKITQTKSNLYKL